MKYNLTILLLSAILFSCGNSESETETVIKSKLTAEDRAICGLMKIDTSLVQLLREQTSATLDKFTPEPLWIYLDNGNMVERPSELKGVYFEATQEASKRYIDVLSGEFQKKGHTIYVCEENFGIDNMKDKVAIVPTADKYTILKETGTDGINYDIDNDSLLKIIREFDTKYELTLIGCNLTWCEFSIGKEPTDWMVLAKECYAVCPDIVEQGTETVEGLAEELRRTKTIYFWWD